MSGDDSDDKITELFPDRDEISTPVDEEQSPVDSREDSVEDGADNVVHLDFRRRATRRSPRPVEDEVTHTASDDPASAVKYRLFCKMIDIGMVMVTLDTRLPGVTVPPKFKGLSELRLNFCHDFRIDDFDYDEEGVRASLSFEGKRSFCDVPWTAVFMLYSHPSGEVVVFEPDSGEDDGESQDESDDD